MQFFRKKNVWTPTWKGWILIILAGAGVMTLFVKTLYPFLAQNRPLPNVPIVVIEGWINDAALELATGKISADQTIIVTGTPLDYGQKILDLKTYAEVAAARLIESGISPERVLCVSTPETVQDRTYTTAIAAREKLEEIRRFGEPVNLITSGQHARRSYQLYRNVFGKEYPVGVISIEPPEFDMQHWYRHSFGVKGVLTETVSWIYTQIFLLTK